MGNENDQQQDFAGPQATNSEFSRQTPGGSGAPDPRQKRRTSSPSPTQLKGDPPKDRKITFKIPIDSEVTGAQLIEKVELYIYKQRVNNNWTRNGTPIDPKKTYPSGIYNVRVPESQYRQIRSQTDQGIGVDINKEGEVPKAKERAKALDKLPKPEQDALKAEIQRRFKEATGKDAKDPNTEAIWDTIRDEVLAQREKATNLSDKAKLIIKPVDKGGIPITPKDYPKLIQLLQKIEAIDQKTIEEYASRTHAHAPSLEAMKQSLQRFLDEQKKRKDNKEKRTGLENKLFGSEGVQSDLTTFRSLSMSESMAAGMGTFSGTASLKFYEAAQEKAKALGFKDITDYEAHIKAYIESFQKEAVQTGIALLQKYEHMLFEEEQRYLHTQDAKKLGDGIAKTGAKQKYNEASTKRSHATMAMGVPANLSKAQIAHIQGMSDQAKRLDQEATTSMESFQPGHPLLKDPAFELKALSQQGPDKTKAYLLQYIKQQREKISNVKAKLLSDQEYVFKLDNLMKHMYAAERLKPNSVPYKAIQAHIKSIKLKDALISIGIAVLAISLGLLSGGGGTVGVLAAAGGVGVSIYDVQREYQQYSEQQDAHDVGLLAKDPSFGWVVLALVGLGFDFAAVGKALKTLKGPVETFEATLKTDSAKALEGFETSLIQIKTLDDKAKANILKRAQNRATYLEKKKLMKGNLNSHLIPYSDRLFEWAVYAMKDGVTRVDDLFIWLKKEKLISATLDQANLTPDQALALRTALKNATESDQFLRTTLSPNLKRRIDAENVHEIRFSNPYSDNDLLMIIGHGRRHNVSKANIEDIIFNSCRSKKQFSRDELMSQMTTWKKVERQGYPTVFKSLDEYKNFSQVVHNLAAKWGLPTDDIVIQGSTLKVNDVTKIDDIDVSIRVDQATFDALVKRFKSIATSSSVQKRIGKNGKIPGEAIKGTPSFMAEFYENVKTVFGGKELVNALQVSKAQVSIINRGGKLEVGPFLKVTGNE